VDARVVATTQRDNALVLRLLFVTGTIAALISALSCGSDGNSKPPQVLTGGGPTLASARGAATETPVPDTLISTPTRQPTIVSLAWLSADISLPPLPPALAASSPDPGLRAAIETAVGDREGSYSVSVQNLDDGRYAAINEGKIYYGASLFKLELLLEAYRQRDSGELDFLRLLTLEKKYVEQDLGTLEPLGLIEGDQLTVADAVRAMIVVSDTPTAVLIQDTLGPPNVDATLRSLGISDSQSANHDLPVTARDMTRLMAAVATGEGVSQGSRHEMLSLLAQEGFRDGIIAALPQNTPVSHKTGSFESATHDVALVWGPAGPYLIAVLTDRSYDWQPIREISSAVWQYFSANP